MITCPSLINILATEVASWNTAAPRVIPLVQFVDAMKVTKVRLEHQLNT